MNLSLLVSRLTCDHPVELEPALEPHPQLAAVLVTLFIKSGQPHVLLIRRSGNLRSHAGEISFPGGVFEPDDESLLHTALRETHEEVGLQLQPEDVIGRLPTVYTLTEFKVSPFLTLQPSLPRLTPSPREVGEIIQAPLAPLFSTLQRDVGFKPEEDMWEFWFRQHRVWGATARILRHITEFL